MAKGTRWNEMTRAAEAPEDRQIWRADQRLNTKEFAPGTTVRYACSPPLFGQVVRREGGSHWVAFPVYGELRCSTNDLKSVEGGK